MYIILFSQLLGQDDSSEDSDDKDEESNEDESDSSDDTFVKDTYFSTSSVWRSYTTRRQAKGMKEGEETDRLNTETGTRGQAWVEVL